MVFHKEFENKFIESEGFKGGRKWFMKWQVFHEDPFFIDRGFFFIGLRSCLS